MSKSITVMDVIRAQNPVVERSHLEKENDALEARIEENDERLEVVDEKIEEEAKKEKVMEEKVEIKRKKRRGRKKDEK